jgi:hypothetical protein
MEKEHSLWLLAENSIEIAWDFLDRSVELEDPEIARCFLRNTIDIMIQEGVRSRLLLSNLAIFAYKQFMERQQHGACPPFVFELSKT